MKKARIPALITALFLAASPVTLLPVHADAVSVVTLGADLDEEERNMIFEFFGADRNSVKTVEINNEQERQYLSGLIADEIIGTHTLSCSYIMPTVSGGLVVKTANLNYIDENMIANALLTAGVENCQVLATAPFEVSGTGALTGIFASYEIAADTHLDEEKKVLATKELVETGKIINENIRHRDENGENYAEYKDDEVKFFQFINDLKKKAVNTQTDTETASNWINESSERYGIDLSEEHVYGLAEYLSQFSSVRYSDDYPDDVDQLTDRIKKGFDITPERGNTEKKAVKKVRTPGAIGRFFTNVKNWFQYIFSLTKADFSKESLKEDIKDNITSIFDNINTDIIKYDIDPENGNGGSE